MAQNRKTADIIKKFGTYEMCNTPEQIKLYRETGDVDNICYSVVHSGVIGCGKTTTIAQGFGLWCLEAQQRGLTGLGIAFVGVSQKRVKENLCNTIVKTWGAGPESYHETHSGKQGYRDAELFGQWIYFIDLKDKGAEERIRGLSNIVGVIFEELSLIDEQKYLMLLGRLRKSLTPDEKAKWPEDWMPCWSVASTNPDGPSHWILKHCSNGSMRLVAWGMKDACYPEAKDNYKRWLKLYKDTPVLYKRNLLGKWVGNDKAVYKAFNLKRHTYTNEEFPYIDISGMSRGFLAVDAGSSHPTAVLKIYKSRGGPYIVTNEKRIAHTAPSDIAIEIGEWYDILNEQFKTEPNLFLDPAAAWLKDELRKHGMGYTNAKNEHLPGINFVRGLLGSDNLLINRDECPNLVAEMSSYEFKNEETDDVVKLGDDFVDALRYGVFTDSVIFGD